ncbi:hypothetical protein GCM10009806_26380 [Microbacterium flavum]
MILGPAQYVRVHGTSGQVKIAQRARGLHRLFFQNLHCFDMGEILGQSRAAQAAQERAIASGRLENAQPSSSAE